MKWLEALATAGMQRGTRIPADLSRIGAMATRKATSTTTFAKRLEALDDDFHTFSGKAPKKAEIDALEKQLGVPLRADHRALIAELSCMAILADEKVWPRPVEYEIRPAWQFVYGIEVFGLAPKTAAALDVVTQTNARKPGGKTKLVAAMARISERRCIGYDKSGTLYEWQPGETPERAKASSLSDVLLGWIKTLETDKGVIKAKPPKSVAKPRLPKAKASTEAKGQATEKTAADWLSELLDDSGNQIGRASCRERV